jgi:hypothetical protein
LFDRAADCGVDTGAALGICCGTKGTARPTSMWPRALSTFGLLNKLNRDILDALRSSFGRGLSGEGTDSVGAGCVASLILIGVDRLRRQREVGLGCAIAATARKNRVEVSQYMNVSVLERGPA